MVTIGLLLKFIIDEPYPVPLSIRYAPTISPLIIGVAVITPTDWVAVPTPAIVALTVNVISG